MTDGLGAAARWDRVGFDGVLEPGMVFTVEPGLYVAEDDESASAEFRGIGVRIEDDVAITGDGFENLTAAIPKRAADVEAGHRAAAM